MMRETRLIMGMPITVEIVDSVPGGMIDAVFDLFTEVDRRFSPYRPDSELCRHERGEIPGPAAQRRDARDHDAGAADKGGDARLFRHPPS